MYRGLGALPILVVLAGVPAQAADLELLAAEKSAIAEEIRESGRDCPEVLTVYVREARHQGTVSLEVYCPDGDGDRPNGLEHYLLDIDTDGKTTIRTYD